MLSFATSVLRESRLIWKRDPAIKQPEPTDSAEDFDRAYARAVETGDWSALLRPGMEPTVFVCRPVPGPTWRVFVDHIRDKANGIGPAQMPALMFALSVVAIENFAPGRKVERVEHVGKDGARSGLGLVLSPAVMSTLDEIDPELVTALGLSLLESRSNANPL